MLREKLNESKKALIEYLKDCHGYDLAQSFLTLSDDEKEKLYTVIPNEKLADLVSYLDADEAADVLTAFDLKRQIDLIDEMEPDDAADIILELDQEEQQELLESLDETSEVLSLIQYEDTQTGSMMTNLFIKLDINLDVKKATKQLIDEAPEVESISTLFVVDDNNKFLGVLELRDLLKAKMPQTVKDLYEVHPYALDFDPIEETISKIKNYDIYQMPVVDKDEHLLGIITLDDALDAYEEEAQEDFEKLAALPETETNQNIIETALHRLPWLLMLLVVSIPIALVTSLFEEVLAAVAILIIFQPLISGSAGNVATQTLAVILKMLSKNEEGIKKNAIREIITGMINGLLIGLLAFGMTFIFTRISGTVVEQPLLIASIVGISLALTVLFAPVIAVIVPLTLRLFKADPAVASGPFITTIIDITAISLYFGLATILLGGV